MTYDSHAVALAVVYKSVGVIPEIYTFFGIYFLAFHAIFSHYTVEMASDYGVSLGIEAFHVVYGYGCSDEKIVLEMLFQRYGRLIAAASGCDERKGQNEVK